MTRTRILGDWGSSNLRLWLVSGSDIVDRRNGPGIVGLARPPGEVLLEQVASWDSTTITLCGMAGARGGLREAPYAECPLPAEDWAARALRFELGGRRVAIAAGCTTGDDVMRGEETQVFGALELSPGLASGSQTIVLPGTHSKWVSVENGGITGLRTFLTGELFSLLQQSSLMAIAGGESMDDEAVAFAEGVERGTERGLPGNLFAVRAAQLLQGRSPAWAKSFLSGILIGGEIADARSRKLLPDSVTLIGEPVLCERYARALSISGVESTRLDGEACAIAGLGMLDADG